MNNQVKTYKPHVAANSIDIPFKAISHLDFSLSAFEDGELRRKDADLWQFYWYQKSYEMGLNGVMPWDQDKTKGGEE